MQKIEDEFTDRPVSRQRKHQLRNREKHREQKKRWRDSKKKNDKHA